MTKSKKDGARRRRMTESEGAALVEEWRKSGLMMSEFSRARGVGVHRLRYWDQRLAHSAAGRAEAPSFVVMSADELEGTGHSDEQVVDHAIEIIVGERFFVRVPPGAGNLADVLHALREADR